MNMSARPRTQASWRIEPTGAGPVRFRLDRATRHRAACLDPCDLEESWAFTGTALVANFRADLHAEAHRATDVAFVASVLGRVRANLLIASAPVVLEDGFLERDIVCDDHRIARIAGAIR